MLLTRLLVSELKFYMVLETIVAKMCNALSWREAGDTCSHVISAQCLHRFPLFFPSSHWFVIFELTILATIREISCSRWGWQTKSTNDTWIEMVFIERFRGHQLLGWKFAMWLGQFSIHSDIHSGFCSHLERGKFFLAIWIFKELGTGNFYAEVTV